MSKQIPVSEIHAAVLSAVEQLLGKEGKLGIDKLWVGFVAPDTVATTEVASELAKKIGGPGAVGSVASAEQRVTGTGPIQSDAIVDLRIVGMILPGTRPGSGGIA